MTNIDTLLDMWMNTPGFKDKLVDNPEATVTAAGLSLTADEWATLRTAVQGMAEGDLATRVSKGIGWN